MCLYNSLLWGCQLFKVSFRKCLYKFNVHIYYDLVRNIINRLRQSVRIYKIKMVDIQHQLNMTWHNLV